MLEVDNSMLANISSVYIMYLMYIDIIQAGFLHVSKNLAALVVKFLGITVIFSVIACVTSLGFPYSANIASPSAQRHVLHVSMFTLFEYHMAYH